MCISYILFLSRKIWVLKEPNKQNAKLEDGRRNYNLILLSNVFVVYTLTYMNKILVKIIA